ncbi:MAG: SUF system Fe-S cluster assembly protein [Luteitalea sp.]|nr:SUF system Fe-S cluster assembly protein [Luteitalea sp.]
MFSLFRKRDDEPTKEPEVAATAPADATAPDESPEVSHPPETAVTSSPESPAEAASTAPGAPGFDYDALFSPPASETAPKAEVGATDEARTAELTPPIIEALRTVYDPEIPVNIYDLGLIYDISVDANARAKVSMTLTSPACPSAQQLPVEVEWKVRDVPGVDQAVVTVVWDPPWSKERMSEEARLALGMF